MIEDLLSAPSIFFLAALPVMYPKSNINPAHPAKYIDDLLYTFNEL